MTCQAGKCRLLTTTCLYSKTRYTKDLMISRALEPQSFLIPDLRGHIQEFSDNDMSKPSVALVTATAND